MKVTVNLDDLVLNTIIDMDEKGYNPKFTYYCVIRTLEDKIEEIKTEFNEKFNTSFDDYVNTPIDQEK